MEGPEFLPQCLIWSEYNLNLYSASQSHWSVVIQTLKKSQPNDTDNVLDLREKTCEL